MSRRSLISALTLVVAAVVLFGMAWWGFNALTGPLPDDTTGASSSGPTCSTDQQKVTSYVRRGDVTVSVYNSGTKSGSAQKTLDLLEQAGFRPGAVGNAPTGVHTPRVAVYTTKGDDPSAELVARAFGKAVQVVRTDQDFGPGVDVVIGNKFRQRLDPAAPRRLELPKPVTTCD